jgi:uncharacterized membrane protein YfcA
MTTTEEIFASYNFYIVIIVLYIAGSIASAGGIGGGGVNVPLLLVIGRFSYHEAVIFSLCTVLGNHIAQSTINWSLSHPYVKQRPLIYWEIILFLLPAQLGGSNVGVLIAKAFPDLLLLCCALCVLVLAIAKTYYKGISYLKEEKKTRKSKTKYQKLLHFANEIENETNSRNQSLLLEGLIDESTNEPNSPSAALLKEQRQIERESNREAAGETAFSLQNPVQNDLSMSSQGTEDDDNEEGGGILASIRESILSAQDVDFGITEDEIATEKCKKKLIFMNEREEEEEEGEQYNPLNHTDKKNHNRNSEKEVRIVVADSKNKQEVDVENQPIDSETGEAEGEGEGSLSTTIYSDISQRITNNKIKRILPKSILFSLFLVFLCYVLLFLILEYVITKCSLTYYVTILSIYPPLLLFIYWSTNYIKIRQQTKSFYSRVKGDIDMEKQSVVLVFLIFCVGILSTLLGIGGGELMGPLFLTYHLLPMVSTATTSMMSLLNTANNIIHYGIAGKLIVYDLILSLWFLSSSCCCFFRSTLSASTNAYFSFFLVLSLSCLFVLSS